MNANAKPTHRVVGGRHHRPNDDSKPFYEPGERITPTEAELRAFPDRFEVIKRPTPSGRLEDHSVADLEAALKKAKAREKADAAEAKKEPASAAADSGQKEDAAFPKRVGNTPFYMLSSGKRVKGKANAEKAEAALAAGAATEDGTEGDGGSGSAKDEE